MTKTKTQYQPQTETQDLEEAMRFLDLLGAKKLTWQTYDDRQPQDRRLARILHGSLKEHADDLCRLNSRGACVSISLNQTDQKGNKRENIQRVRACVVDLDGEPWENVRDCGLRPHLKVETSPDRFHGYWLVTGGFPLDEFEAVQRSIAARFNGDPAVALLTHRARVPGFFHNKKEPFRVRMVCLGAHDPYTTDEILAEFPPLKKEKVRPANKSGLLLPVGVPLKCAEEFLKARFVSGGVVTLRRHRGGCFAWTGTHYKPVGDETLKNELCDFLNGARVETEDGTWAPFNPTPSKINQIFEMVKLGTLVDADAVKLGVLREVDKNPPFWMKDLGLPAHLMACRNGLLDYETGEIHPHSAEFFNVNALPYDYDPDAPKPERWHQFLLELWPDDKQARLCLQEIFGLLLTADTSYQKIFMVVGPMRSGKGTIGQVATAMLGADNVSSPTMASLGTQFGLGPLIYTRLAIVPDARLGSAEARKAIEHLLSVSGEDSLTIDRKYQDHWTGKLSARFLMLTNELPRFADASRALTSRFVILTLQESYYGREELDLKEKLQLELPGILNWALRGLDRLQARGYFRVPQSSLDAMQQMHDLSSPVSAFVRDRSELGPDLRIEKAKLFDQWKLWCETAGEKAGSASMFGRNLRAAFPQVRPAHSGSVKYYDGIAAKVPGYVDEEEPDEAE